MRVYFIVPGPCVAKPRPRFSSKTGRVYTPNNGHKYEKLVRECYGDNKSFEDKFIKIKIIFWFEIPKSYSKQKRQDCAEGFIRPSRADIDNYIKSVLDGLNKVAYADDRYIYKIEAEKRYTENEARTEITIESGYIYGKKI